MVYLSLEGGQGIVLDASYADIEGLVFDGVDPSVTGLTVDPATPPTWVEFDLSLSQNVSGTSKLRLNSVVYISEM